MVLIRADSLALNMLTMRNVRLIMVYRELRERILLLLNIKEIHLPA